VSGVAATQPMSTTIIAATNIQKPTQESSLRAANMWLRLARMPVVSTNVTCIQMNSRNQHITRKCSDLATWMLSGVLTNRSLVESAGESPRPVIRAPGAAIKTVKKYANTCRAL
jgi:hypothetical protein